MGHLSQMITPLAWLPLPVPTSRGSACTHTGGKRRPATRSRRRSAGGRQSATVGGYVRVRNRCPALLTATKHVHTSPRSAFGACLCPGIPHTRVRIRCLEPRWFSGTTGEVIFPVHHACYSCACCMTPP